MSRCALSCVGIVSPDGVEDAIRVEKIGTKDKNWEREKGKDTDGIIRRERKRKRRRKLERIIKEKQRKAGNPGRE